MRRLFAPLALLVAATGVAAADITPNGISITSFDPEDAVAPVSTVEGPGVKIGESTVIHPVVGFETGFVSNVFYSADNPTPGGVLRLLAQVGAGSLEGIRLSSPNESDDNGQNGGEFQYRASVRASYDEMLGGSDSSGQAVGDTGGLGLGALFRGLANPMGTWSFGFNEEFVRLIRAANFETDANTNRDINTLALRVLLHPHDSTLGGWLSFTNTVDVFERSQQQFANRMLNQGDLYVQWRWLPQTTLFGDVSFGINGGIGSSKKVSSFPLTVQAGIQTLLSLKTTFSFHGGYTNGFYSTGQSYSSPTIGADLGYRYSPMGRIALTYDWMYEDSVNANYYRDHVVRMWLQQLVVPFVFMAQPEIHFREYSGVSTIVPGAMDTRDDTIISVVAGVHYIFRNWIAGTLDYRFTDVSTNFRYMAGTTPNENPSFVRHELLLGMRIAM
jgi:hypothetical protein